VATGRATATRSGTARAGSKAPIRAPSRMDEGSNLYAFDAKGRYESGQP